jgi:hypothetical protein
MTQQITGWGQTRGHQPKLNGVVRRVGGGTTWTQGGSGSQISKGQSLIKKGRTLLGSHVTTIDERRPPLVLSGLFPPRKIAS